MGGIAFGAAIQRWLAARPTGPDAVGSSRFYVARVARDASLFNARSTHEDGPLAHVPIEKPSAAPGATTRAGLHRIRVDERVLGVERALRSQTR
jgi:hypothetical protein